MVFKDLDGLVPQPVTLARERQVALTDTADRVVAEALRSYEQYIANHRQVDARLWKHVKSREKVHVYRTRRADAKKSLELVHARQVSRPRLLSNDTIERQQRQAHAAGRPHGFTPDDEDASFVERLAGDKDDSGTSRSHSSTHSSSSDTGAFCVFPEESVLEKLKPLQVPLVTASGTIDGHIDDVAFGALAHTDDAWFKRNSYVKNDGFDGRKVLASFQVPTDEDPFRYVGIKWATRPIAAFASRRDLLFLESSGIALDSDGERVYYSLAHSVELDECPLLPDWCNVVRMNLSVCFIMRQVSATQIEVYARGYADMGGNLPAVVGLSVFSQGIVDVVGIVEASYLKKLVWRLACHRAAHAPSRGATTASACSVCHQSTKRFGKLIQTGGTCAICRQLICQKCSVQKKLLLDVKENIQRQLTFCVSCVIATRKLSAWDVAVAQLKREQTQQQQ